MSEREYHALRSALASARNAEWLNEPQAAQGVIDLLKRMFSENII